MQGAKRRVSVGLPVYNGAKYIRTSLDSLLGQTFGEFELIICDNDSNDDTEKICREYAQRDSRIRYVRNPSNLGGPRNFNRAFELATGEYFKWSTADDFWGKEMLAQSVAVLDAHPDVVLCYPKTVLCDASGRVIENYEDGLHLMEDRAEERFIRLVMTIGLSHQHQGLIRSSALRRTALLGNHLSSDINLLAELTLYGKFFELPDRMFFRRLHPESSSWDRQDLDRQLAYYDPLRTIRLHGHKWHACAAFLTAVRRSPLGWKEKVRLYERVLRLTYWRRAELLSDLAEERQWFGRAPRGPREADAAQGSPPDRQ
jgi:glycosyltransferase involved in cell wall biosynthesis